MFVASLVAWSQDIDPMRSELSYCHLKLSFSHTHGHGGHSHYFKQMGYTLCVVYGVGALLLYASDLHLHPQLDHGQIEVVQGFRSGARTFPLHVQRCSRSSSHLSIISLSPYQLAMAMHLSEIGDRYDSFSYLIFRGSDTLDGRDPGDGAAVVAEVVDAPALVLEIAAAPSPELAQVEGVLGVAVVGHAVRPAAHHHAVPLGHRLVA